MSNQCVCFGAQIPEGIQVCAKCAGSKQPQAKYTAMAYRGQSPLFSTVGTLAEVTEWAESILASEKSIYKVEFERCG